MGSGASTPAWANTSIEGLGYGVERLHMTQSGGALQEEDEDADDGDEDEEELDGEDEDETEEQVERDNKQAAKKKKGAYHLKPLLIQAIQELIDELETVDGNIAKDARDHVHSG